MTTTAATRIDAAIRHIEDVLRWPGDLYIGAVTESEHWLPVTVHLGSEPPAPGG